MIENWARDMEEEIVSNRWRDLAGIGEKIDVASQ